MKEVDIGQETEVITGRDQEVITGQDPEVTKGRIPEDVIIGIMKRIMTEIGTDQEDGHIHVIVTVIVKREDVFVVVKQDI